MGERGPPHPEGAVPTVLLPPLLNILGPVDNIVQNFVIQQPGNAGIPSYKRLVSRMRGIIVEIIG